METVGDTYQDICDRKVKEQKKREKREEKVRKLTIVAKEGLITPPKGLWKWKKCPGCGEELHVGKWSDGGYPDYGDKYMHYICADCNYEYGKTGGWIDNLDVVVCTFGIIVVAAFILLAIAINIDAIASYFGPGFGLLDYINSR